MNRDEALKKSEEALTELAETLKAGKSDALVKCQVSTYLAIVIPLNPDLRVRLD